MESSSDERQVILKSFGFEKRNKKKKKKERWVQTSFQNRTSKQLPHINPRNV